MEEYLRYTKTGLADLSRFQKIHGILGNEACDLDSAISSLVYSYYLYSVQSGEDATLYLPLLNIPCAQFSLRTETTHFLSKLHLSHDLLTFRDEVDLHEWHKEGKLVLTLVDHNVLPGKDTILEDCVTMVIDHHVLERTDSERTEVVLDSVGSCCTLVAEQLLQHPFFSMDDQTATMLYGTILIDTVKQSAEAGKTTARDEEVLGELSRKLPNVNAQELFEELQEAKLNISGLSNHEILLKDLKKIGNANMTIAMCSVTMNLQVLMDRDGFVQDLKSFCESQGAEVSVLMTVSRTGGSMERQLAVYSENRIFRQQIADLLDTSSDLELEPHLTTADSILCFSQGNVKASRKKVIPILKSFLTGEETPGVDMSGFPFEGLETETIGSDVPLTNIKDSFNQEVSQEFSDEFSQNSNADPFGLFSGGGEAGAENKFSNGNPFTGSGEQFEDFLSGSTNSNGNHAQGQLQSGSEFDPFGFTSPEKDNETKTENAGNPMDSFIDGLLSGSNSGAAEPATTKDTLNSKLDAPSDQESPLELSSEVTSAGSSYPVTPPNSYMESDMERFAKQHNLPSFNTSEMVKIIKERQASMEQDNVILEEEDEGEGLPYPPRNSYQESPMESFDEHHDLPSFQGPEMFQRIMDKRASLTDGLGSAFGGDSPDGDVKIESSAEEMGNVVALGLAQDIKGTNPFDGAQSNAVADNVVAQTLAQEMLESDPFSLGITHTEPVSQSTEEMTADDPFSLGLITNTSDNPDLAKTTSDVTDSDPFSFGLTANTSDNPDLAKTTSDITDSDPFSFGLTTNTSDNPDLAKTTSDATDSDPFSFGLTTDTADNPDLGKITSNVTDSDPFSFGLMDSSNQENVVADSIAQEMKSSNPFTIENEHDSSKNAEDRNNADDILAERITQEMTTSNPFSIEDEQDSNENANNGNNTEQILATRIAQEMKPSNPFSIEYEQDSNENANDGTDSVQPDGVVREPSVENFQDFLPEQERNVISPDRSLAHGATPEASTAGHSDASRIEDIFGYSNAESDLKGKFFQHNTEEMAEEIIRQNLEEAQQKGTDQMAGFATQGSSHDISPDSDHDLDELVGGRGFTVSGLENPAFGSDEETEENLVAEYRIAEEIDSSGILGTESEELSSSDNLVAVSIAEEMSANPAFDSGVESKGHVEEENIVASSLAEEIKAEGIHDDNLTSSENVVATRIAQEIMENSPFQGESEDQVDLNQENIVAVRLAEDMKAAEITAISKDDISSENVVAASIAEQMKLEGLSQDSVDEGKSKFGRMDSQYLLENENVIAGLIANDMKADMFTDDDPPIETSGVEKKSKGVKFSESISSSSDSDDAEEHVEETHNQDLQSGGSEGKQFEVAQKFAEDIISEACEIVSKDDPTTASATRSAAPKGLSRSEMARRMMEADEFASDEESEKDHSEEDRENVDDEKEASFGEDDTVELTSGLQKVEEGHLETLQQAVQNQEDQEEENDEEPQKDSDELAESDQHEGEEIEETAADSEVSVAQRITDKVLTEALGHVSREHDDAAIAEKIAEAMEESEGEGDADEMDLKTHPKEAGFADDNGTQEMGVRFETLDNSEEKEILSSVSQRQEHMDNEWDKMEEFESGVHVNEDNGNMINGVTNSSNKTADTTDLSPDSEQAVRDVAFDMASDIIQKALDTFPVEELQEVEHSDESLSSPPSSDISPNSEGFPQTEMKRSHEMCPIATKNTENTEQNFELPLETEYLPNVDPLRGNLDIVTSPVKALETGAVKEVAEDTSFKQLSTEVYSSQSESESEQSVIEDLTPSKVSSLNASAAEDKESVISSPAGTEDVLQKDELPLSAAEHVDLVAEAIEPTSQPVSVVTEDSAALHVETGQDSDKTESAVSRRAADDKVMEAVGSEADAIVMGSKQKKEIYMTTAGRISISTDLPDESEDDFRGHQMAFSGDTIAEESRQQVGEILARAESVVGHVDAKLACSPNEVTSDTTKKDDVTDEEFLSTKTTMALAEAMADTDDVEVKVMQEDIGSRVVPIETEVRLRQDSESSDTMSKSARPSTLSISPASQGKRKIHPNLDLMAGGEETDSDVTLEDDTSLSSDDPDLLQGVDDLKTPDITTPDAMAMAPPGLAWENDTPVASPAAEAIPEYTAEEESHDHKSWRTVTIGDQQFTIDMKVVEPYKRVLSHGGYYGEGLNAMIVFSGCYLPDRSRKDYSYVMENLFFYVISTLELLVAEDYMIVYFHGATPRRQMPSFGWLKRCYQMIDRRLKKNLKGLLLVHPTLWIKTVVMMSRPFISTKFSSKLKMVKTLADLEKLVPMEYVFVPDQVKQVDKVAVLNPAAVEKGYEDPEELSAPARPKSPEKKTKKLRFWKRKK